MSPSGGGSSDDDEGSLHDVKPPLTGSDRAGTGRGAPHKGGGEGPPAGKKTKGRVKIKMEFIDNKLRRYTTFSKRKTGIMKKVMQRKVVIVIVYSFAFVFQARVFTKQERST